MAQPAYYSLNQSGSSGPDVALIQKWLNGIPSNCSPTLTVDGKFGSLTQQAVRNFQSRSGLSIDGKVGQNTWNALYSAYAAIHGEGEQYPGIVMRSGSSGATVRGAQIKLNAKGAGLSTDGKYGSKTEQAVRNFQSRNGLSVDGSIGQNTWAKLYA